MLFRGLLKFVVTQIFEVTAFHFPLFKEGLREIFGRHYALAAQNPPQSSFTNEEVLCQQNLFFCSFEFQQILKLLQPA